MIRLHENASRILILGGTTEASQLAARLAGRPDLVAISSLAGRLKQLVLPPGAVRIGGFGGVDGLVSYLVSNRISLVVDATHPFAATMSSHAEAACEQLEIPLIVLERLAWKAEEEDQWHCVPDLESAAALVNFTENRVFLSVGRQELAVFSNCEAAWFLIRAIDPPAESLPPRSKLILQRGPFHLIDELELLRRDSINYLVTKNSGGTATYPKLQAARRLGIPVVMVDRPLRRITPAVTNLEVLLERVEEYL